MFSYSHSKSDKTSGVVWKGLEYRQRVERYLVVVCFNNFSNWSVIYIFRTILTYLGKLRQHLQLVKHTRGQLHFGKLCNTPTYFRKIIGFRSEEHTLNSSHANI